MSARDIAYKNRRFATKWVEIRKIDDLNLDSDEEEDAFSFESDLSDHDDVSSKKSEHNSIMAKSLTQAEKLNAPNIKDNLDED